MSGSSGTGVLSIARSNDPSLSPAENHNVSSVLSGAAWNARTITYSFPTTPDVYGSPSTYGDPAPFNGFLPLTAQQKGEILRGFSLISSYTGLSFSEIAETADTHATLRFANSFSPATAYAFFPGTYAQAGDVFFGRLGRNPVMGNSDSGQVLLHDIGHALGLKHAHDVLTYGAMNADRRDIEFSLMNYPNYIGSTEGYQTASTSPQTFMMYDIAALQHMYGASFNRVGQTDTYSWSATTGAGFIDGVSQGTPFDNHIFQTIWTGGATATYDLSNFAQDQVDDMNPGGWLSFSTAQLAHLNAVAPTKADGDIHARGNVYNALLADGDTRSLVNNIITGVGNDTITGNAAGNEIRAGAGNDKVSAGSGNDRVFGAAGNDTLAGDAGNDLLDGGQGIDMLAGGLGKDVFAYAAGYGADTILDYFKRDDDAIDFTRMAGVGSLLDVIARGIQVMADAVFDFGNGDRLTVKNVQVASLEASDFILAPIAPTQIIEQAGSTSLVQVGNGFFMPVVGETTGPQLMSGGAPVVAVTSETWRPIAAEAAETGYVVVWKNGEADLYFVWNTDGNGNFTGYATGVVSGSDYAFQSLETTFQQDLNGDGTTGLKTTPLETSGATRLDQVGNEFFLHDGGGNGPSLKYASADVVAGEYGSWTPLGAEKVGSGYQVVWKNGEADLYFVWNLDGNGNFTGYATGVVSGSDYAFQSLEMTFQQDLNGDGTTGLKTTPLETSGATRLDQVGNEFFLHDGGGNGPSLKYASADVVAGEYGSWTPLGAEKVGSGYQVVWKNGEADLYFVWNLDGNGNFTGYATGVVSGSDYAFQSLETTFQQDLNGDGTTGLKTTPLETSGATRLDQVGNEFFLHDGGGNGPSLKYASADVVAGEYGSWTPLGAEKVGSGYQVVWKNGEADLYFVWNLDGNGNFTGYATGVVSGSDYAFQSLETTFQQDLNGDGTTGLKTTPLETSGATRLDQVGNEFFLHDGGGNGPSLKYASADVVAGEYGSWTPLGAEKVGSGYQVVWKNGEADLYFVWNLDGNGNFTGYATGVVSGSDYAFQSLETTFQQDLNGDGTTGLKTTPLETSGATRLDQVGNEFFLHDGGGNGPSLKYASADVVAGEYGSWTPLGAEKVGSGYQVVWKNGEADLYFVWNLDGNGNFTGYATGVVSGSDYAFQSLETTFQQDLNGDGTTGLKTTPLETSGATRLDQVGNEFFLHDGGGNGPSLKYASADVVAGEYGSWTPLGAEKVGSGYQVVWKNGEADLYFVWNLDGNGNFTGYATGVVSGSDYAFQSLETTFQQDLNGDGTTLFHQDLSGDGKIGAASIGPELALLY